MPHDVRSPHIFQDGPGNTASGDQVMDNLDALWAAIDLLVAPGTIRMSGTASPETGWLLCDGAAVSRTTYSALFAKCGTAFGVGDGSTTFNLPDLRGRAPIGVGTGTSLTARAMGAKVGAETHGLSAAEAGVSPLNVEAFVTNPTARANVVAATAHNNMQPSQAVNFFIKS